MPARREETQHEAFQRQILEVCTIYGWKHLHVRRAIGKHRGWVTPTNLIGYPDLTLFNPKRGGVCAIEVKIKPDKPSDEQVEILTMMSKAGVPTLVLYPDGMDQLIPFLLESAGNLTPCEPIGLLNAS